MVRLPCRVRSIDDDLQSLQSLVTPSLLDGPDGGPGRDWRSTDFERHRQHLCEGASLGPRRKRGAKSQAIGPSRGGQTTKVHALTDTIGRPYAFELTAGNVSDAKAARLLFNRLAGARRLLADKGYDANAIRRELRQSGIVPVIPGRINRKRQIVYDKQRYRERHLIENAFCRIKDFRRVHTRYDKLTRNFLSAVAIAVLVAFWL